MKLNYGKKGVEINLPDNITWGVLDKEMPFVPKDETEIILSGIESLLEQLDPKINTGCRLLLVVPDHTRRCRLELILPPLIEALEQEFEATIDILVANGSHIIQPEEKVRELLSPKIFDKYPVTQHDYMDADTLLYLGETSFGTPIWLNKKVKEADFIITIGGILYHYFAGFGGGPKMLLPGIAGQKTILNNHRRTIDPETGQFHKNIHEGNITTNPVFRDLSESVDFVPNSLSLQFALSPKGSIVYAEAGSILGTHKSVCEKVKDIYSIEIKEKADIVVASAGGFPSDVNLIQSHKSIHHAFQAVKKNGVIIVFAECSEGVGSNSFMPFFEEKDSLAIGHRLLKDYRINGHTALTLKTKTENAHIIFVTQMEAELVQKTGMIPAKTADEAFEIAQNLLPKRGKGYILPTGQIHVPVFVN